MNPYCCHRKDCKDVNCPGRNTPAEDDCDDPYTRVDRIFAAATLVILILMIAVMSTVGGCR